jgi:putative PIN family toxin of toxin-antitoxin system
LDTNVAVSALLWQGRPSELFNLASAKAIILISSAPLLAELADVLSRAKFQHRIAASKLSVDDILYLYAEKVLSVRPSSVPRIAPDPDDDVVIGTALAANADLIVTGDSGLLSVERYRNIRIVTVAEALQLTTSN